MGGADMGGMRDTIQFGRSKLIRYRPGESWQQRHDRRLKLSAEGRDAFQQWCEQRGIQFRCTNGDHHWQMRRGAKLTEWWPSSAKCVVDQQWDKGVHVHDCEQLQRFLACLWGV